MEDIKVQDQKGSYEIPKHKLSISLRHCFQVPEGYVWASCIAKGSLIKTNRGLIPIENCIINDTVITSQGNGEVITVINQGIKEVYKVTTSLGYSINTTLDHLFLIGTKQGFSWKKLEEINVNDWVILNKNNFNPNKEIEFKDGNLDSVLENLLTRKPFYKCPKCNNFNTYKNGGYKHIPKGRCKDCNKDFKLKDTTYVYLDKQKEVKLSNKILDVKFAEFLGLFYADGCIVKGNNNTYRTLCISLGDDEKEHCESLINFGLEYFGKEFKARGKGDYRLESTALANWFSRFKINSGQMSIPAELFISSEKVICAFLRGYIDAEGYLSKTVKGKKKWARSITIVCKDVKFLKEIHYLLLKIGVKSRFKFIETNTNAGLFKGAHLSISSYQSIKTYKEKIGFKTKAKIELLDRYFKEVNNFRDFSDGIPGEFLGIKNRLISIKRALENNCPSYFLSPNILYENIKSVEYLGLEEVYDLEVKNTHCFEANGFVVHNCDFSGQEARLAAALSKDKKMGDVYILEDKYIKGIIPKPKDPEGNTYEDPQTDLHVISATALSSEVRDLVENKPWLANKNNPLVAEYRNKGKTLSYGLIYGSSAAGIAEQLNSTPEEAEALINKYYGYPDGFYDLDKWIKVNGNLAMKCRWVKTPTGRFIYINESNAKGLEDKGTAGRKAVNSIIQSLGTDMLKLSLPKLELKWQELNKRYKELLKGREPKLTNLSHDEGNAAVPGYIEVILVNNKDGTLKEFKSILDEDYYEGIKKEEFKMALDYGNAIKQSMEEAEDFIFQDILNSNIPSRADLSLSKYWLH